MRPARTALGVLAALAVLPAGAQAASISYIGSDGNAYLTTPDGTRTVQLTHDATPAARYRLAGQSDDGQIVVHREKFFTWLNPDGSTATGPWRFAEPGSGGIGPLNAQVAPGGTLVAVDWNSGTPTSPGSWRVVKMPRGPHTDQCTFGCIDNVVRPRWVPGAEIGFISENLRTVSVQMPGQATPQEWFEVENHYTSSFDVSRTDKIVIEAFPDTGGNPPKTLAVLQNTGLPPATPTFVCELPNFSQSGGFPRWSPDGKHLVWEDAAGVQVSPAPVNQNGTCVLSPRLVAPGGRSPDWGVRDVPTPSSPGGPGGPGDGSVPQGPPRPPDPPKPCCVQPSAEVRVAVAGRLPRLAAALRRGLSLTLRADRAGRFDVVLLTGGSRARAAQRTTVLARGAATARRAGEVRVTVRFTRAAKRRLRRTRRVALDTRATFTGSDGTRGVATRRIVLRR